MAKKFDPKKFLPQDISGLKFAFGAISGLMPPYSQIPKEFKDHYNPYCELFSKFLVGGCKGVSFIPKEGIVLEQAIRHLSTIIRSYEPKHEHKEAAVAYMFSLWFEDIKDADGKSLVGK